jgi:pimeloyl-ACP methyl ester carboxylesterase
MASLSVNGLEIAYRRAGSGPPLVLVHGAAGDGREWAPQLSSLADQLTVIAWDEPGAGRSGDPPEDFTLADYADCLAGLIEGVAGGPAHVGGISWGGTVAIELHRRHPDLIASLILAGTYAGWRGSLPAAEVEARLLSVRAMIADPEVEELALPNLFASDPSPPVQSLLAEVGADVRPATLVREVEIMAATDLGYHLPEIDVPTLLIWGEHDERSPLTVARHFATAIPRARLVVIPGAGHLTNLESPKGFDEAVRGFCGTDADRGAGSDQPAPGPDRGC